MNKKLEIEIPEYDGESIDVLWDPTGKYSIEVEDDNVVLSADRAGLLSIAKQLLYFAENDFLKGTHVHLDSFFCKNMYGTYSLTIEVDL